MGIGYCMVMLFMLAVCKTTRNCRRQEAEDFAQSMELCMRGAIVGLVPQEFPAQPSTRAACKGQHTTRARVKAHGIALFMSWGLIRGTGVIESASLPANRIK